MVGVSRRKPDLPSGREIEFLSVDLRDEEAARAAFEPLTLTSLLLSYAEFDAPVRAKAIFDRADTAAFAGQGMGIAVTLRAQDGGVHFCIDEDLAHCICTPLRQPHISGLRTNTICVAANPNRRSSRQLFHQTGCLLQENLRVRRNLGAIGSEKNGWEINSRLISERQLGFRR